MEIDRELVDVLTRAGAGSVNHHGSTLLAHLSGTARLLDLWNCPPHVCKAGLWHSFYSWVADPTERSRAAVRAAIGDEAEVLIYLFCHTAPEDLVCAQHDGDELLLKCGATVVRVSADTYAQLLLIDRANAEEMLQRETFAPSHREVLRARCAVVMRLLEDIERSRQPGCPYHEQLHSGQEPALSPTPTTDSDGTEPVAEFVLRIWRLHPNGVRVSRADPTLGGLAPESARQFCGPYIHANGAGFYVYSPIDVDLSLDPDRPFPWEWNILGEGYTDEDVAVVKSMRIQHPRFERDFIKRRPKLFLSGDDTEPKHTAQLWTGCIFETPPGWSLLVRSPINRGLDAPFRIQESIIESDWLRYDIWLNLEFMKFGVEAQIRRAGEPIAHIIPIPRQSYDRWHVQERMVAPEDEEAQQVFDDWIDYNWEKFHSRADGAREQRTYARRRKRLRDRVRDV